MFFFLYEIYASIRTQVPFVSLLRSQLPIFLIALAAASSAAAFATNVECCEKELHMDEKLARFGVPFGQVLFMPGFIAMCVTSPLYMAKEYGSAMTPAWLVTMVIVAAILAIAAPPIPGDAITNTLILLSQ